jgi:hypothetical protein
MALHLPKHFLSISGSSDADGSDLERPTIRIRANRDEGTITIKDTGVGMTKLELMNNLGRIAQSGTRKFLEALGEGGGAGNGDVNLIGQLGVGFFSAYLVADRVTVVAKSMQPNSKQLRWTSDASDSYTITEEEEGTDEPIDGSGTKLILQLKDDALEYLEISKLESLLEHYSEFIEFPISVWKEKTDYVKVVDEDAMAKEIVEEGGGDGEGEGSDDETKKEPKMKTVATTTKGYEQMNTNKPIWLRSPSDPTNVRGIREVNVSGPVSDINVVGVANIRPRSVDEPHAIRDQFHPRPPRDATASSASRSSGRRRARHRPDGRRRRLAYPRKAENCIGVVQASRPRNELAAQGTADAQVGDSRRLRGVASSLSRVLLLLLLLHHPDAIIGPYIRERNQERILIHHVHHAIAVEYHGFGIHEEWRCIAVAIAIVSIVSLVYPRRIAKADVIAIDRGAPEAVAERHVDGEAVGQEDREEAIAAQGRDDRDY